jgi:hypothetical protein
MSRHLLMAQVARKVWQRVGEPARRFGLAAWILRLLVLAPSPLAADPAAQAKNLSVQDVLIEGKLYSPQALFILSRTVEEFDRDAVLPHYLGQTSTVRLLPYRLRGDVFFAALASQAVVVGDSTVVSPVSRRSP